MSDKSIMSLTDDEIDAILNQLPSSIHQSVKNETLRLTLAGVDEKIRKLNGSLAYYQSVSAQIQAELDRRTLEDYWTAHPDLIRLEVGDKLQITEEFHKHKIEVLGAEVAQWDIDRHWPLGTIYKIRTVNPLTGEGHIQELDETGGTSCPYRIMDKMRRAYLEQESRNAPTP